MRTTPQTDAWTLEAIRLSRRYQIEIVEACGLCPWATRARTEGAVRERVLLQPEAALLEASLEVIEELAHEKSDGESPHSGARSTPVEVALLIYPRLPLGRMEFEHFAARVRNADAGRRPLGEAPFMFAAFHPDAEPDMEDPERLIPFLRRTPDPTIQLVRSSVLERVRAGTPQGTQFVDVRNLDVNVEYAVPLRERIARTNLATAERMGVAELKRRMDAIVGDREATYRRLAAESWEAAPASTA